MRFAQGADALQIAECGRFYAGNFFRIQIESRHAALQKIRCLRSLPDHRAQFGSGHAYVSRYALDFRFAAAFEI
jgi:hypothetical protein